MTNYRAWDRKADELCREAEEEEQKETAAANEALGLSDGPKGPPTVQAEKELHSLGAHSKQRNDFIAWQHEREITLTHSQDGTVDLSEYKGKAIRLKGCKAVKYVVPCGGVLKLMLDSCSDVQLHLQGSLVTSTLELYKCQQVEVTLDQPLGTLQVDECAKDLLVRFAERDFFGKAYHQNSPGFAIAFGLTGGAASSQTIGREGAYQLMSCIAEGSLHTEPVRRGEGEFPLDLGRAAKRQDQPEPEALPAAEERQKEAERQRIAGNEMFRASDFAQAAALYTLALEMAPDMGSVWANRAQCWLKLGDHEKALADAKKCTEVEPTNPKGWFRQGMSLHAMQRYAEAIPLLLEAEKLEPSNRQIQDAIKMAQMKARNTA